MSLAEVVTSRQWTAAGLTMLHYLWIGALLGAVSAVIRAWVRPRRPAARYAAALFCLGMLTAAPIGIYLWALTPLDTASPAVAGSTVGENNRAGTSLAAMESIESWPPHGGSSRLGSAQLAAIWQFAVSRLDHVLPWFWLAGTGIMLTTVLMGTAGTWRLCRGTHSLSGTLVDFQCRRIAHSLGVARRVLVVVSDRIVAPVVVGVWRPTIILPLAVWTGLQPVQIEMILWHELAHVRRYDNLLNFIERVVQSLLFFQPAVWIVCRWVRLERENCCDAVALCHTTSRHAYAETLASLAAPGLRLPGPLASAANHQLVARIRCILHPDEKPTSAFTRIGPQVVSLAIALGCVATVWAQRGPTGHLPAIAFASDKPHPAALPPHPAMEANPTGRQPTAEALPAWRSAVGSASAVRAARRPTSHDLRATHTSARKLSAPSLTAGAESRISAISPSPASAMVVPERGGGSSPPVAENTGVGPRELATAAAIRALGGWVYHDELGRVEEVNLAFRDSPDGRLHNDVSPNSDAGLRQIDAFLNLKRLTLYRGQATDEALRSLADVKTLEVISCWNTPAVTDEGVRALSGLTNLREVYFDVGRLGDGALAVFGKLPNLEVLRMLIGNEVTDVGLHQLAGARRLRELAIGQGKHPITDRGVAPLLKLQSLEILNLQDSQLSLRGVERLKALPNLKHLQVNAGEVYQRSGGEWARLQ